MVRLTLSMVMLKDDKLRTVSGDITLTGYTGDVNLGLLTAAEDVVGSTVTYVD